MARSRTIFMDVLNKNTINLMATLICIVVFLVGDVFAGSSKQKTVQLGLAPNFTQKILKIIFLELPEEDRKKLEIKFNRELPMADCITIYGYLMRENRLLMIEKLNCADGKIKFLPESLFMYMDNLRKLDLSGNPEINLKSEAFQKVCQNLTELDISRCNIDKETFLIIFNNCTQLETLRMSDNPKLGFPAQNEIVLGSALKDTLKELRIDNCNLNTAAMEELRSFKCLKVLDISRNCLKDFFDSKSDLGHLKETLVDFSASKTGMTSDYLFRIGECMKISVMDISYNNLRREECKFLDSLANQLTSLKISRANLSPDQLEELLDFPKIAMLDCSWNDFSKLKGSFRVGRAKNMLEDGKFSNCRLSGQVFLEEILYCQFLARLDVSKNKFGTSFEDFIFGPSAESLKWLDISESEIRVESLFKILGASEMLEFLDISGNYSECASSDGPFRQFDPAMVVSVLGNLKRTLKTLKISACRIDNNFDLFYDFTNCEVLEIFDISENNFSKFPRNFRFGSSAETLKELHMNKCLLDGAYSFGTITNLKSLTTLSINENYKNASAINFSPGCSKYSLKTLSMFNCGTLDQSIFTTIAQCKALKFLDLSRNNLSSFNRVRFCFGSSRSSLQDVNLKQCFINSEVLLRALTDCRSLRKLNLEGNLFSRLSDGFRFGDSRKMLESLNMSACGFHGQSILSAIAGCRSLGKLDLSYNDFSGVFSNFSFGRAGQSLKILKMDYCKINDPLLFTALTSCYKMEKLSLSFNSLSSFVFGASGKTLREINLSGNVFASAEDLYRVFNYPKVERIDISTTQLNTIESELKFPRFKRARKVLRELVIADCQLARSTILGIFTNFPKLEKLDISKSSFCPFCQGFSLGDSKNSLVQIKAEDSNFGEKYIIKALTDCQNLEVLLLKHNSNLAKISSVEFGSSTGSLRELSLSEIRFSSWGNELKKCTRLQKLELKACDLSGCASEFSFRNSLVHLNLSYCKSFNSEILSVLTTFYWLETLNLDGNCLRGLSPEFDFGNLAYTLEHTFLRNCDLDEAVTSRIQSSLVYSKCLK